MECSLCKKVFLNSTFLDLHHKKWHAGLSFSLNHKESQIKILEEEVHYLKQQLLAYESNQNQPNEYSPRNLIKMKPNPEVRCLETQELYWRGKLQELCVSLEEEKKCMRNALHELKTENLHLREQIASREGKAKTSIAVQTDAIAELPPTDLQNSLHTQKYVPPASEPFPFNKNMESLNRFSSLLSNKNSSGIHITKDSSFVDIPEEFKLSFDASFDKVEYSSTPIQHRSLVIPKTNTSEKTVDVIHQVNTFIENYNQKRKETEWPLSPTYDDTRKEEVKKVIAKLFTSDETSEHLANKLIKMYDKCTSSVSDDEVNKNSNLQLSSAFVNPELPMPSTKLQPQLEDIKTSCISVASPFKTLNTSSCPKVEILSSSVTLAKSPTEKRELKILPFFKNIPSKVMKNYSKSRKVCAHIGDKMIKIPNSNRSDNKLSNKNGFSHETELKELSNSTTLVNEPYLKAKPEPILLTALKKSRSTGNIIKKVAFSNELPTLRTSSETDLYKSFYSNRKSLSTKNGIVCTIDVHQFKSKVPIPAPRSKKKIVAFQD